jgi:very-short-patch-repair endonuclease
MLEYKPQLKARARSLRNNLTDAEKRLWSRLRRKQILGVQFLRQRPTGNYIVDFYAPSVKWVVEVDGSQHFEAIQAKHDKERSLSLKQIGLKILRFGDRQVLTETEAV